jgi:hypothetical protein
MTPSQIITDRTMLDVIIGTYRDRPVMVSKSGLLSSIRSTVPVDAVG